MIITAGSTNRSVPVYFVDDDGGTAPGEPTTGLLFSDIETGGSASYQRQGAARVDFTLVTQTVAGAHTDGGFVLIDDTNMPGLYRLDVPDAAFATGVDFVIIQLVAAAANNTLMRPLLVVLSDFDLRDSVRGGLTALPNVAAGSAGGLPDDTDSNGAVRIVDGTGPRELNTNSGAVALVDTVTTLTGHTAQTGDSFARIGATGSGLTSLASATGISTIADRIGAFTGSGVNTVLGFFQALMRNDATLPTDIGGTYDDANESMQALKAAIGAIASGGSGALNFANEADNIGSAIKSISFDGVETSGTNASVNTEDGTYHVIDDTANNIDIVYQFDVGGGRTATEVLWKGYLTGSNDVATIQAYNGSTWDTLFTIAGKVGTTNDVETLPLLSTHTGTGADLGKVFIRIECAAQSNPTLNTDQLLVSAVNVGQSVGYALGAIWIDITNGTAGTEAFVNGTADNPVNSIADAVSLSSSTGLQRFVVAAGSSITLAASAANYEMMGESWTLACNSQSLAGAHIVGATVSGTFTGNPILERCIINAITGPGATMRSCYLNDVAITNNGTDNWYLNDCRSRVAGTGSPNFDFGAAVGAMGLSMRAYSGGIEIENMATGDTMSLEGDGALTINANCTDGSLALRGNFRLTDNAAGAVEVVPTVPTIRQVDQGTAQAGSATTITLAATASATNGQYDPGEITIIAGTGAGQSRGIIDYNGTTKVAVVNKDWRTNPDTTSSYVVTSSSGALHVNEGQAQAGAATTITLNTAASATDDIYIGQTVFLVGGAGQDQARIITDYNGTTKVATVHRAWDTNPGATTSYVIVPLPTIGDVLAAVPKKNTALNDVQIKMVLSSDHATPATGLSPTLTRSIDGAAFGAKDASTTVAEIGSTGIYQLDLAAADTNGTMVTYRLTAGTADAAELTIRFA